MSTAVVADTGFRLIGPLPINGAKGTTGATPLVGAESFSIWERLLEEIQHLGQLGADWDGQGAEAPAPANVSWALEWVQQMRQYPQAIPPSRAFPGVVGEVYLEWQGESFYLVAEICSPARVEWTLSAPGQPNRHWITEGRIPYFLSPGR